MSGGQTDCGIYRWVSAKRCNFSADALELCLFFALTHWLVETLWVANWLGQTVYGLFDKTDALELYIAFCINPLMCREPFEWQIDWDIHQWVSLQKRCNSSAIALELHHFCSTNPLNSYVLKIGHNWADAISIGLILAQFWLIITWDIHSLYICIYTCICLFLFWEWLAQMYLYNADCILQYFVLLNMFADEHFKFSCFHFDIIIIGDIRNDDIHT